MYLLGWNIVQQALPVEYEDFQPFVGTKPWCNPYTDSQITAVLKVFNAEGQGSHADAALQEGAGATPVKSAAPQFLRLESEPG